MKTKLILVAILILIVLCLRFFLGGPEDLWICDKGEWKKHGNPSYPKPAVSCKGKLILPKNKNDCLAQGGVWKKQGIDSFESCNRKALDRGNLCRDSSECEGMCLVELTKEEMGLGMRGKLSTKKKYGQCSVWVVEFGCNGIMRQGEVQVRCVD